MIRVARTQQERLNLVRREKFDITLPKAMRENNIDMWIHVIREGNPDPLRLDLGDDIGYFIFTDRDGDRIERVVLGGREDVLRGTGAYDAYDLFGLEEDLGQFVAERDPKHIAVNMSEKIAAADGLSYTGYLKLVKLLGEKYGERLTSAEKLITDFRTRRVTSEIVEYGHLCEITRQLLERALSNEVIRPGVTTREDVAWWWEEQLLTRGMANSCGFFGPGVLHPGKTEDSDDERQLKLPPALTHLLCC